MLSIAYTIVMKYVVLHIKLISKYVDSVQYTRSYATTLTKDILHTHHTDKV